MTNQYIYPQTGEATKTQETTYTTPKYIPDTKPSLHKGVSGKPTKVQAVKSTRYTPQFFYKDDPKKPVANAKVLYWVFKPGTNELFHRSDNNELCCGVGITDDDGYLHDWNCPDCSHSCKAWHLSKENDGTKIIYKYLPPNFNCPIYSEAPPAKLHIKEKSKAGFCILPARHIELLKSMPLEKLLDDSKLKDCWIKFGSATSDTDLTCKIEIPRNLNNWVAWLSKNTSELRVALAEYDNDVKKDIQYIAEVECTKTYLQYMLKYPRGNISADENKKMSSLISALTQLQETVSNTYIWVSPLVA